MILNKSKYKMKTTNLIESMKFQRNYFTGIFTIEPVRYLLCCFNKLFIRNNKIISFVIALTIMFFLPSLWEGSGLGAQNVGINTTGSGAKDQPVSFTQSDRDRLIRMETILEQHDKRFESIDKRFESIDKRFESIDKRFESIDRRFEELRTDTNTRFGWLIALFTAMMISTIGFALWDRRTMIRPFETKVKEIETTIEELRDEKTMSKILAVLRDLAKTDSKIAEALRTYSLF